MTTNMTYRRFIPPPVPSGQAADNSVFALLMLARVRNKVKEKVQQKVGLDHWEDEGGSLAETDVATPRSPPSDRPRLKHTV
jgi:hypothetical protein